MQDKENLEDVRLDIQTVGFTPDADLEASVLDALTKLRRFYKGDLATAEVYMKLEPNQRSNDKHVGIKYGVPGNDVFADDNGDNWYTLLNSVAAKLHRQLDKRFGNLTSGNRGNIDEIDPASLA
ncbi:MAG TPA: HPF/RaiA family ribosome-associated protein [Hymenobacter sp.]|jgi:putative sigma-54 modulation protein|nr:HPF/RaiA family ribosome-associated protein [Hymenobacter sp.]